MKKRGYWTPAPLVVLCLTLAAAVGGAVAAESGDYIAIDEIRPDMEAYCLTVFSGTTVERFPLKLLSVVRGVEPGQDMILVIGTDERFQHAGTVHGCSGSPVFIDGRLAGALAAGWDGALDSLYLVRPIHDMLAVGRAGADAVPTEARAFRYDFSQPLDMASVYQQSVEQMRTWPSGKRMLLPLVSSLPAAVCQSLAEPLEQMGFIPVTAGGMMPSARDAGTLERGGTLSVPLCSGDISLAVTGTVTEMVGDQVYGFGHAFTGRGPTALPMSAGLVHTVVAGRERSFKLATPGPVLGTVMFDQSSAIRGTIGVMPTLVPMTIGVKRFNDPQERTYQCRLAADRVFMPMVARIACGGAALMQGPLPPEHTVTYHGRIRVQGYEPIEFANISSGQSTMEVEQLVFSTLSLLLNNPFEPLTVEAVEVEMEILPVSRLADVWSVDLSRTQVRPGQSITAEVVFKSFRSKDRAATLTLTVPEHVEDGRYTLQIMSDPEYRRFLAKAAPQRFRIYDGATLVAGLRRLHRFRNDRLHAVMAIPASGLVMRQHVLPKLPQTRMLLMQDDKRLRPVEAYNDWVETQIQLDYIVDGAAEAAITVRR